MKNRTLKKISLLIALLMLALTAPRTVFDGAFACLVSASPGEKCGDGITWTLDGSGTLTLSGTGDMYDYDSSDDTPWYANKDDIKKLVIGSGVVTVGTSAFSECNELVTVVFGSSVKTINEYAFYHCLKLNSVSFPAGLKRIGDYAFEECGSLKTVTVPDSVTEIGKGAFDGCRSLEKITAGSGNANYSSDVYGVLFNKDKTELIRYPAGSGKTGYTIPDSVRSIGDCAFSGSKNLKSITFGSGAESIGKSAFSGCSGLSVVNVPEGVKSIGCFAFENCSSLKSASLPDSLISLSYQVFDGSALYENESNWQDGVLYVSSHLADSKYDISGEYTVKKGTLTIAESAFFQHQDLTGIKIPGSVKTIGDLAFYGCGGLVSATIGNGITSFGYCTFRGCYKLERMIVPDSVKEIGEGAFEDCGSLSTLLMPEGVSSIGDYAFANCSGLKSVKIPGSVTKIGVYAFYGCAFASVTIPSGVKNIGAYSLGYYRKYDYYTDSFVDTRIDGFKISCYPISAGENYAKDNGFEYKIIIPRPTVTKGDVNSDGRIDSTDFILIKRHILKTALLSGNALSAADTDGSGIIDSTDYIVLKRYMLGLDPMRNAEFKNAELR